MEPLLLGGKKTGISTKPVLVPVAGEETVHIFEARFHCHCNLHALNLGYIPESQNTSKNVFRDV